MRAKITIDEYDKLKGTHSELENELKNVRDLLNEAQKENKEFKIQMITSKKEHVSSK